MKRRRERGAALIIVLWTSVFVSAALIVATAAVRQDARIEAARTENLRRTLAAENGLEYAALMITTESRPSAEVLADLEYVSNGYRVEFRLADSAGKLDLNLATESQLQNLMVALGVDEDEAVILAARIADWRDADDLSRPNGAERSDYAAARDGERIGNRLFYSPDELNLVLGMPKTVVQCALPLVTILGTSGDFNVPTDETFAADGSATTNERRTSRLGTASRSAVAGQRHAISAVAVKKGEGRRRALSRTGLLRLTGDRVRPYEWIVQFNEPVVLRDTNECTPLLDPAIAE